MNFFAAHKRSLIALGILLVIIVVLSGVLYYGSRLGWFSRAQQPWQVQTLQNTSDAFNKNDFAGAMQNAESLLKQDPKSIPGLLAKATILAQEGSLGFKEQEYGQQAIAVAQQVLAVNPKSDAAWWVLGYANEIMQNYDAAHQAYAKAIEYNPKNALAIAQDAHAYDLQGNADKAKAGYQQALAIDPNLDLANLGMARMLIKENNIKDASSNLNRVIATTQNLRYKAEASYMSGTIQMDLDRDSDAENLFRQATVVDPSFALGWYGLGHVLFVEAAATSTKLSTTQRNALAKQSLQYLIKATQLNPNQSIAYMQIGYELVYIGQAQNGVKVMQNAAKVVPNDITLSASDKQAVLAQINQFLKLFKAAV